MRTYQNVLVIKYGALGDVVRTSYFAKAIKAARPQTNLHWITHPACVPLISHNPHIDVIHTDTTAITDMDFDVVYSLDDELEALKLASSLQTRQIVGAHLDHQGKPVYTDSVAAWFDMGLNSRFPKARADELKRLNALTHATIFASIFETQRPSPDFHGAPQSEEAAMAQCQELRLGYDLLVGINAFAGARWPSKSMPVDQYHDLVRQLIGGQLAGRRVKVLLLGAKDDAQHNRALYEQLGRPADITPLDTSQDVLDLAGIIKGLDVLITSDSLALHLAIGQHVPVVTFFASTSAAEIENGPTIAKVVSTAPDYCSYMPHADNSTITSDRILAAMRDVLEKP